MRFFIAIFSLIFLAGCKSDINANENDQEELDTTILAKNISQPNTEVNLLPEARKHVVQWVNYITAQNEINNLKTASVSEVIENAKPISQIMQSLKTTVPDTLRSPAVDARLTVLATKAQVLEQLASRRNKNLSQITKTAEEIPVEFNNFKLQLNELFLKSLEDFEFELDELEREQDSIARTGRGIQDSV